MLLPMHREEKWTYCSKPILVSALRTKPGLIYFYSAEYLSNKKRIIRVITPGFLFCKILYQTGVANYWIVKTTGKVSSL